MTAHLSQLLFQCVVVRFAGGKELLGSHAFQFQFVERIIERRQARSPLQGAFANLLDDRLLLRLDQFEVVGALGMFGRSRPQLDLHSLLRLLGQLVKNPHAEKCRRKRAEDPVFDILALDRLRVRAAGTAQFVDRQALLVIGAAVAILAHDRVGPCAFSAFEKSRQEI
ncbi:hypothetical protein LQK83_21540 [Rhizobium sp. C1]|nr:hypothetical protein [Rhizobium sp. C1]